MFASGHGTYVSGRLIVLDYAALSGGHERAAGGHQRPGRVRAPTRRHLSPPRRPSTSSSTSTASPRLPLLVAARHDAHGRWRSAEDEPARALGHAWAWKLSAPVGRPRSRRRRFTRRQRRVPERPRLVRADDQPAAEQRGGLRAAHRRPVGRAHTAGAFVQGGRIEDRGRPHPGTAATYAFASIAVNARDDATVGFSEFESDDFVDAAYAFTPGTGPAEHDAGAGHAQRRRGAVHEDAWRPQSLGRLQRAQVDPSDDLSLWTVQVFARIPTGRGDGRAAGAPGGAGSEAASPCPRRNARCREWSSRPCEGMAASRKRALPPVEGASREVPGEAGSSRPPEPGSRPDPPKRRQSEPHGRPLANVSILEGLRGLAQLARASACHAEGRGFESDHPLQGKPRSGGVFC